jgi:ATP-dependent Lon protease
VSKEEERMVFMPRGGADKEERGKDEKIVVPNELPILPLRGTVLYPDLILPIMVGRKKSVKLIDDAMDSDRIIGVITQKRSEVEDPKEGDLHSCRVPPDPEDDPRAGGSQRSSFKGLRMHRK